MFSFTRRADGAGNRIQAAHVNELQDAIEVMSRRTFWVREGVAGSNAATEQELMAAITAVGSTGGRVLVPPGMVITMRTSGTIGGDSLTTPYAAYVGAATGPLAIVGGPGSTLRLANGQPANTIPLLVRGSSAAKRTNSTLIQGLTFDGNIGADGSNQGSWTDFSLCEIAYSDYVTVDRCEFRESPFALFQAYRNSQYVRFTRNRTFHAARNATITHQVRFETINVLVDGCEFIAPLNSSLDSLLCIVGNNDIGINSRNVKVLNSTFYGGLTQLTIGGGRSIVVAGNTLGNQSNLNARCISVEPNNASNAGAAAQDATDVLIALNTLYNLRQGIILSTNTTIAPARGCKRIKVIANDMENGPDVGFAFGILEVGAEVNYNEYRDNTIKGATTAWTYVGANNQRSGNRRYSTSGALTGQDSNSGTATIAGGTTSVTVNHTLGEAPTRVLLTCTSPATVAPSVQNKGVSSFDITVPSAVGAATTFDWRAQAGEG